MSELLNSLGTVLETLGKGWRFSLAGALASAALLFLPTSWLPFLDKARADYGVLALVVLLACGFHVATFAIDRARTLGAAVRKGRREARQMLSLLRLTTPEKLLLEHVREGSATVVESSSHPAIRTLLMAGILRYHGQPRRIEQMGCIVYQVTGWAFAAFQKDPWLLDVTEHEGPDEPR